MTYALSPESRYIVWKPVPSTVRPGKTDKFPVDYRSGRVVDAHDPAIWTDRVTAQAAATRLGGSHGVGFVIAAPTWFLDIDHCLIDGAWSPLAIELCQALPGCYVEVSHSGEGLHIIGRGEAPPHGTKNAALGLELYSSGRFCALTFTNATGDMLHPGEIAPVATRYFPPTAQAATPAEWTDGPCEGWDGHTDDDELIAHASRTSSAGAAFNGRPTFRDLWEANEEVLGRVYSDLSGTRPFDASVADAALASHLAFWTGKDAERIKRLMERSGLHREKYERDDYLYRTIIRACSLQREVHTRGRSKGGIGHNGGPPLNDGAPASASRGAASAHGILTAVDFPKHFEGVVYIEDRYVAAAPDGTLLTPQQFRVSGRYGGRRFILQPEGRSKTNAWEALTENELWKPPFAHSLCFRPELPPRALIEDCSRIMFNCYQPIVVASTPGDCGPFLRHLELLLPDPRDRAWLLSWMARVVQSPGFKAQWMPMIQGTEGNGKSILIEVMVQAVGEQYSHLPSAQDLSNKFNSWADRRLFIGIEEIFVRERRDLVDVLKVLVTNRRIEIQAKGKDQIMADNRANFMACTNHLDALPKTGDDRRYAIFKTAQQSAEDLIRDGMNGLYFDRLFAWLRGGGYANVTHMLRTMPIPAEMDPAGLAQRAPVTSSTADAIVASRGPVEQAVMEAIENDERGFSGGWVSSYWLSVMLDARRLRPRCPPNAWDGVLRSLGYVKHPVLPLGRVNQPLAVDAGKKPKLWVREGHLALNIESPAAVGAAYEKAQGGLTTTEGRVA